MTENLKKMTIKLEKTSWHDEIYESVWVKQINNNIYQLDNLPFYAYNISLNDFLIGKFKDKILYFDIVGLHNGHSTYRIIKNKKSDLNEIIKKIQKEISIFKCSFEGNGKGLFSIDVPPDGDIDGLYNWLLEGEKENLWSFEEAHYGRHLAAGDS